MQHVIESFSERIRAAAGTGSGLCIRGSGSKDFYAQALYGDPFDVTGYSGIVEYEPKELVITARAGTLLKEVETALSKCGQMLGFEPPSFGEGATLGGCIASGLSGPRRVYSGAVRDFVLGVRVLDGRGADLRFGGQVMKNVAGYDVSRLMTGSMGTLGVILEASLKVLPMPVAETTTRFEMDSGTAIRRMNEWAGKPLPVSATCHEAKTLSVRLSGSAGAVHAALDGLGGDILALDESYWSGIREQTAAFFTQPGALWRLSVPSTALPLNLPGRQLIEWGGALRWLKTDAAATPIRAAVEQVGGQATLFRGNGEPGDRFHPLSAALEALHRRIKNALDPQGIFNRGRIYPGL
ncbi:MAG: glycolate oxidase subunit GlcE [Burkholderiales bacterium]